MTPEEKANELIEKFQKHAYQGSGWGSGTMKDDYYEHIEETKQCALICVDEILKIQPLRSTKQAAKFDRYSESDSAEYWQKVKEHLSK